MKSLYLRNFNPVVVCLTGKEESSEAYDLNFVTGG